MARLFSDGVPSWMYRLASLSLFFLMAVGLISGIGFATQSDLYGGKKIFALVVGYGLAGLSVISGVFLFFFVDLVERNASRS